MTFTKENAGKYQAKGVKTKLKQRDDWWAFIASGGLRQYRELMDKLANGEKIEKPQEQFLDRTERSFPYIKGKKGNVDDKGNTIGMNINILNASTDDLQRILEAGSSS